MRGQFGVRQGLQLCVVVTAAVASMATSQARPPVAVSQQAAMATNAQGDWHDWGEVLVLVESGTQEGLTRRPVFVVDETVGQYIEAASWVDPTPDANGMFSRHIMIRPTRQRGHRYSIRTMTGSPEVWTLFDTAVPLRPIENDREQSVRAITFPYTRNADGSIPCATSVVDVTFSNGRGLWSAPPSAATGDCVPVETTVTQPISPNRMPVRYDARTPVEPWARNTSPIVIIQVR